MAERRERITEMITLLNEEELAEIYKTLRQPFFSHQLKEYTINGDLPDIDNPEFKFLIDAARYHGNISRKLITKHGISNYYFKKFVEKYQLRELDRGMYIFPGKTIDELFLFQSQYSKSVISHETALYMHELSDVIPRATVMSIPKNYNMKQLYTNKREWVSLNEEYSDGIHLVRNEPIFKKEIVLKQSTCNNLLRVTSVTRTLVDILKKNARVEEEIKVNAYKRYLRSDQANILRLRRIAKEQSVSTELEKYLN